MVYRTSRGYIEKIDIFLVVNLNNFVKKIKKEDFWIYVSALKKEAIEISKIKFYFKLALVIGNETKGVSDILCNKSDFLFYIKMLNNVNSLNVNAALSAILTYIKFNTNLTLN